MGYQKYGSSGEGVYFPRKASHGITSFPCLVDLKLYGKSIWPDDVHGGFLGSEVCGHVGLRDLLERERSLAIATGWRGLEYATFDGLNEKFFGFDMAGENQVDLLREGCCVAWL